MLDRLQLTSYQAGLLSRGVQSRMDPREPFNRVLDTAIGVAGAVGVAAFDDMCQEHGIFRTFSLLFFTTFALLHPSTLFPLSFTFPRKDKTRAIDPMT